MEGGKEMDVGAKTGFEIPLFNEVAAIYIGCGLTSPEADPKFKAALEDCLPRLEKVDVVYKQNTANEVNIVVPSFPQYDGELQRLTEQQIEKITGGAFEIVGIVGIVGGIGVMLIGAGGVTAVGATGSVASVMLFGTVIGVNAAAVAAGAAAVGLAAGAGIVAAAVVSTAVGLGIAAGAGAFNSGPVSVGHAS
ncbi:MAG: hypothetical protein OXU44_03880 [Gammaproteobacteria bacterium]|nr:hypothetical protein [Gammaproteobacteria bacterium]